MTEDQFLPFMEVVSDTGDDLEAYAEVDGSKASGNLTRSLSVLPDYILDNIISRLEDARDIAVVQAFKRECLSQCKEIAFQQDLSCWKTNLTLYVFKQRIVGFIASVQLGSIEDVIVAFVPVVLIYFVYFYLTGYIDKGGSKADSSGSLDFRDIYISIDLFQAAYVWIKFRDVIPRGAVYHRRDSNKYEPRIKFPVTRGVGGKSKRIPLGLYNTFAEGEVAYQIAAFYCKKQKHTGQLDLGGGASFPIPTLSLDPNLPYEEKVKFVRDQVLRVYAEFEEQKAARNLSPCVPGLASEMRNGEGQLIASSSIHQLRRFLNSGMDLAMECQGFQLDPNIHNGVDFNNPRSVLLLHVEIQHELLDAHKQIECLKAQVSRTEIESMGWEIKYSELKRENGLLNQQIMQLQSRLQTQHQEQEFDTNRFLSMGHE